MLDTTNTKTMIIRKTVAQTVDDIIEELLHATSFEVDEATDANIERIIDIVRNQEELIINLRKYKKNARTSYRSLQKCYDKTLEVIKERDSADNILIGHQMKLMRELRNQPTSGWLFLFGLVTILTFVYCTILLFVK